MQKAEYEVQLEQLMPLFLEQFAQGKSVKFAPRGVSMLPMLRQGMDCVVLSPLPEKLQKYDLPLYRRADGKYVLHRVVDAGETYTCMGDNQFVPEPGLRHDQMIAVVTSFTRDGKRISVNDPLYKVYCRVWTISRPVRHLFIRIRSVLGRIKRLIF